MKIFDPTLIYLIFDVESIGDGPRVPRAHLEVVFATSHHNKQPTPVTDTYCDTSVLIPLLSPMSGKSTM